jgi:hypothetical protein
MPMVLPSLNAFQLLHSIKCTKLQPEGLTIRFIFRQAFRNTKKNMIERVKVVTDKPHFIFHVSALFKKADYEIFIQNMT